MRDHRGLELLTREQCLQRLGRGGIGRVAVSVGALPAIFPVNYAILAGDIVFRSGPGTKLNAALRGSVVAFEVDQSDGFAHTGWSVTVVGPAHEITEPDELARAITLPLASWAPGDDDVFVRVETRLVSGRELSHALAPAGGSGLPLAACPACASDALVAVSDGELTNFVCTTCFACWHVSLGAVYQLPVASCPGCRLVDLCRAARPSDTTAREETRPRGSSTPRPQSRSSTPTSAGDCWRPGRLAGWGS